MLENTFDAGLVPCRDHGQHAPLPHCFTQPLTIRTARLWHSRKARGLSTAMDRPRLADWLSRISAYHRILTTMRQSFDGFLSLRSLRAVFRPVRDPSRAQARSHEGYVHQSRSETCTPRATGCDCDKVVVNSHFHLQYATNSANGEKGHS